MRKVTDEQVKEALKSLSVKKASKLLGISERATWTRKAKLARQGWSPEHDMTKTVPDGFHLKGTSTLYDEEGNATRGRGPAQSAIQDRWSEVAIPLTLPFAAAQALPHDVWRAISVLLRGAR